MGASNGADTLCHLKKLTRADIAAIVRGLYGELKELPGCNMSMPTIDGDSNNICLRAIVVFISNHYCSYHMYCHKGVMPIALACLL